MFEIGDTIVHPIRGAGVVISIEKRQWQGSSNLYYKIRLLAQPGTSLMIPIRTAEAMGLRRAIPRSRLDQVWRVLRADPETLPADHKERYQLLESKLHTGNILRVAEAVRDMAWRKQREGNLTTRGKRMYEEGMMLLTGEIAAAQGVDLADAEAQVRQKLKESLSPNLST